MSLIGHNNGPTIEKGQGWRVHCWKKARRELLPQLPLEVIRMRVRRAKELGLEYKTYASLRSASGRDVIAFLFSSNALRVFQIDEALPKEREDRLKAVRKCGKLLLVSKPLQPEVTRAQMLQDHGIVLDDVKSAPRFTDGWAEIKSGVRAVLDPKKLPGAAVVMVGDTSWEREWTVAGKLGAYLPAEIFFGDRTN